MIVDTGRSKIESNCVAESHEFGISYKDSAHIMTILRDTLYSDHILAVIREYSSNAWDAHRQIGKGDVPIKVTIPTRASPTLVIRDFGPGLSKNDVFNVYTQYGASTKRDSNDTVGMLGIGSKSGFAYADSFTVTSWNGGKKCVYSATLDETNKGLINLLSESDCGDETGIEISIAVRNNDINEFISCASKFYAYMKPRPDINIDINPLPVAALQLEQGDLLGSGGEFVALMGCVPYPIDTFKLGSGIETPGYIHRLSGILRFKIGEIQISASREELKYDDNTKKVIIDRINMLVDEYVRILLEELSKLDGWQRRLRAQVLVDLGLPVSKDLSELFSRSVSIIDNMPDGFSILRNNKQVESIRISDDTCLVIHNDNVRKLKGYDLGINDYIVKARDKSMSVDALAKSLDEYCKKIDIAGVDINLLTDRHWTKPYRGSGLIVKNNKHSARAFKLNLAISNPSAASEYWEAVDREPTSNDIFVVLEQFKAVNLIDFIADVRGIRRLHAALNKEMPQIYGYKTTKRKPISNNDCVGTHYSEWRNKLITSTAEELGEDFKLFVFRDSMRYMDSFACVKKPKTIYKEVIKQIGPNHEITILFKRYLKSAKIQRAKFDEIVRSCGDIYTTVSDDINESVSKVFSKYPLMSHDSKNRNIALLCSEDSEAWFQYINLIDKYVTEATK